MPGTDLQWDRYIAAYDANETARQAFVDKMRRINLGEAFDAEQMQRDATELEGLFVEMIEAAKPITWTGNGHISGTPDYEGFLIRSHQAPEGSPPAGAQQARRPRAAAPTGRRSPPRAGVGHR